MSKVEARKAERKSLSEGMQKAYSLYFNTLLEIMGDKPVSIITRKILKDAVLTIGLLPKRSLKAYKGVSVSELLQVFAYAVEKRLLKCHRLLV